jgi:triphosphoribosyl-dephospho-CoA synthase
VRAHVAWRYGACGAVSEAAAGFPSVFTIGLPALRAARRRTGDVRLARLAALVALMARVHDTNVLHRGGVAGLRFVHERAAALACDPDLLTAHGAARARHLHAELVARRLSPGGCADLLAGTLFVDAVQRAAA